MISRANDYKSIKLALKESTKFVDDSLLVAQGNSLDLLKNIPDASISLILTDPPYHSTKKKNIFGDTSFSEDKEYISWMDKYFHEWRRIIKPNGSVFCFCASEMEAQLTSSLSVDFNILSHVVWTKPNEPGFDGWKQKMKKEALRQWYPHTERIIFAEPAFDGNIFHTYFGNLIREARQKACLTMKEVTEITGDYGKVNHGGAVSNWEAGRNVPSSDQYKRLSEAFIKTGKVKTMPKYEDVVRPFITDSSKEFTDVWNFPSVRPYKGKHPAEKPLSLLEHAIASTTNPGDIVLDCFSGSGNTAIAALRQKRRSVMIEIENKWVNQLVKRIKNPLGKNYFEREINNKNKNILKINPENILQLPLVLGRK